MEAVLLGVGGLVLLLVGAELLVRSGSRLATRLGLSPMVIGLTVVSVGTSLPELAIGIDAARSGSPGIATGNIVGTNLANLLLVLGLGALLRPVAFDRRTLRFDLPAMVAAALLLFVLSRDGSIGPAGGVVLLLAAVGYVVLVLRTSPREDVTAEADAGDGRGGPPVQLLVLVVSLALVVLGAEWLVDGAVQGALVLGVDEAVIGLTVVALGTSAPELVTMLVAVARRETGLAVGNLVGSSVLNIALVLGATVLAAPGATIAVPPDVVDADLVLLVVATLGAGLAMRTGSRLSRPEGGLLVLGYAAYLTWLVLTRV
ncbi:MULTISPECIES: calcium/sodium antiporter [Pseudonocardia]|uniref:calcium/sodium antiporter n=1 Tax=Pseudonocardia TaxID=1847 RepID=UPI001AD678A7|nr:MULTISPECIES: calcium/sodium antiporter [Pseudonocardia]MBO4237772.1 calcium/sodium antiporter [Pseudonocardia alni]MCM3845918.1 calcium/sodium antiporter [Pseudonocardia sp. DR1-2]